MLNTNFPPWPSYTQEEVEAVSSVLLSNKVNYWTGDQTKKFEKEFAEWTGTKYAVALTNGTIALDLSLKALGVKSGDEVIVSPRTYIASVSAIINVGAIPVFADVDLNSQCITAESIKEVISKKTRAIICVHLAGHPCDMDPILDLTKTKGIAILELIFILILRYIYTPRNRMDQCLFYFLK